MRAERANLEVPRGPKDNSPGQARNERRFVYETKNDLLSFSNLVCPELFRGKPDWKREIGCGVALTQDGGLGGLVLGYYRAAPGGAPVFVALRQGEPEAT
jgi:hypothetical protein